MDEKKVSIDHQLFPTTPGLEEMRILVIGYRQQIVAQLLRLKLPFAIWHNQPIKRKFDCLKILIGDFPRTAADIRAIVAREFLPLGPFSHVIAGTEASVYPASVSRRTSGARKSKDSIALRCSDKQMMKQLMEQNGIPMTPFDVASKDVTPQQIFDRLGPTVVVKQKRNSGGRGLTIARSVEDIASRNERGLLYEKYIDAHEMSIESFVSDGKVQFTSVTNYLVKTHANIVPANLPSKIVRQAESINRQVIDVLKLSWGLTHAEYYWNDNEVLFGEIALRPPGGYIMECISLAHQFDAWEAFVANEIGLPFSFPSKCTQTAGVAMLHAGQGTVTAVSNVEQARQLPSCQKFKLLVKPNEVVKQRAGVGEISAYGMFRSADANQVAADALKCLELVKFQMDDIESGLKFE